MDFRYDGSMARAKTTVYIEEDLLREARVLAARLGRRDYEVFEAALAAYLGMAAVQGPWSRSQLDGDEALRLAYEELHRSA
jgi:hypothetical protein